MSAVGRRGKPIEALALWRGGALSDFAYEPFAQSAIAQLEELRLACLETRFDLDLDAGRHGAVVGELEALTRDHPLRERFRVQLMLALYRSERQAEALAVYQAGRRLLAEELGLEPSEALKSLQMAILAHDHGLALPDRPVSEPPEEAQPSPQASDGDRRTTRKTVTILFAATEAADGDEFDPEVYRRLAGRAFSEISAAVEHYGGTVETRADGALTAIFGVPTVHEDDALRALRAAADAREQLRLGEDTEGTSAGRLDLRLALSTGEIVTGGGAAGPRSSGRPITVAVRLGQKAGAGDLLLDESTYRLVKEAVDVDACADGLRVVSLHAEIGRSVAASTCRWSVADVSAGGCAMRSNRLSEIDPASCLRSWEPQGRKVPPRSGVPGRMRRRDRCPRPVPSLRRRHHLLPTDGGRARRGRPRGHGLTCGGFGEDCCAS